MPSKASLHRQVFTAHMAPFALILPNNQRIQWVSKKWLLPPVLCQGVKFWDVQRVSDTAREGAWAASSSRKFHRLHLGNWGCEGNKQTLCLLLLRGCREGAGCLALALWSWQWPHVWNQGHTCTPSCHLRHSAVCPLCTQIVEKEEDWAPCGGMLKLSL